MGFHNVHAEIANLAQTQPGELRDRFAHLPKNILDRVNSIAAAERLEQVAQNLPILARVAGRAHRTIQSLQSSVTVNH